MHEATTKPSQPVERAEDGEEIVIARRGEPVARLVAIRRGSGLASVRGAMRDRIAVADDFDELPEDIARASGAGCD
ncbi:type II toxin-antitoxin system Phd/YefM family antitoxin [Miltoncostaea marina]|uniref:type II toxin-antitoxin system Phd/YefM family antitoxin n=1 Tax=Miltoncostaea marina TaxID=2843215 RepID=UPI001C3E8631|nr:type II toxin-antitoxin system prevent-host-death family antitoxin [Miltoncostaea marina]